MEIQTVKGVFDKNFLEKILKWNNINLKRKLIYSFVFFIVFSALITGFVSYKVLEKDSLQKLNQSKLNTIQTTMDSIDYRLKEFDRLHIIYYLTDGWQN